MSRASHLPPIASPALCALRLSFVPALGFSLPPQCHKFSTSPLRGLLSKTHMPNSLYLASSIIQKLTGPTISGNARPRGPGQSLN